MKSYLTPRAVLCSLQMCTSTSTASHFTRYKGSSVQKQTTYTYSLHAQRLGDTLTTITQHTWLEMVVLLSLTMADSTASCPICNKSVPLEAINSHIDICLLPGGAELHKELLPSKSSGNISSVTTASSSLAVPQPHTVQSTLLGKRASPCQSPSTSKQSFFSFATPKEAHQSGTGTPPPPPTKKGKIGGSKTVDTAASSLDTVATTTRYRIMM